jgi:hypothetical protein
MFQAHDDNGELVDARVSWRGRYACPECGGPLYWVKSSIGHGGVEIRIPHFRHSSESKCPMRQYDEHIEHALGVRTLLDMFPGVTEQALMTGRRADLVTMIDGKPATIEYQRSNIGLDEISGRIADHNAAGYGAAWVFVGKLLRRYDIPFTDGPNEALHLAGWQGAKLRRGRLYSSHVFYDASSVEALNYPEVIDVDVTPPEGERPAMKHVVSPLASMYVPALDIGRIEHEWHKRAKNARRGVAYVSLVAIHQMALEMMEQAKFMASENARGMYDREPPDLWRRIFMDRVREEESKHVVAIPEGVRRAAYVGHCDRIRRQAAAERRSKEKYRTLANSEIDRDGSEYEAQQPPERTRAGGWQGQAQAQKDLDAWNRLQERAVQEAERIRHETAMPVSDEERAKREVAEADRQRRLAEYTAYSERIERLKEDDKRMRAENLRRSWGVSGTPSSSN